MSKANNDTPFKDFIAIGSLPGYGSLWLMEARMTARDFCLSLGIRNSAMRPILERRWPWNDHYHKRLHLDRYRRKNQHFIASERYGVIGTVSFIPDGDTLCLSEFYITPVQQGQGVGGEVLRHCCEISDRMSVPIVLEHLLWNPARRLYERHGFREVAADSIYRTMIYHPKPGPLGG